MVHVNKGTTGATGIRDTRILVRRELYQEPQRGEEDRRFVVPSWWWLVAEVAMKEAVYIVWGSVWGG
jgi:hypothetical protein